MSDTILRYKYLPLDDSFKKGDKYKAGSLCVIKDGTMKFTNPKEFNDPFDCRPKINAENHIAFRIEKAINAGVTKTYDELERIVRNSVEKEIKQDDYFCQDGICCLLKNPLNLLMWAHYASMHTGFVVEFCIPRKGRTTEEAINVLYPTEVIYKKDRPIVDLQDIYSLDASSNIETRQKIFDALYLTKSLDWEYEQEERVIDYQRGADIYPYNRKQILKSVIAGMRMSDEDFATLKNAVDKVNQELNINVTVHKAHPVEEKFALYVPDREDLKIHNNL